LHSGDFQLNFGEEADSSEEEIARKRKSVTGKTKRTKECPGCGTLLSVSIKECSLCDYQFTSKSMLTANQSVAQESNAFREKFPFEPERVFNLLLIYLDKYF
jgi:ribosomal protein L37AE/L43A